MPNLLFISEIDPPGPWKKALEECVPGLEVKVWPDADTSREFDYVLCWKPPISALKDLTGVRAVFSLGAGVDHLAELAETMNDVPVVRMVEPALTEGMTGYVVYQVLRFHRSMPEYEAQRARREWRELPQIRPRDRRIGIMGLGVLGTEAASALVALGFDVSGWSRSAKSIEGVRSFSGTGELPAFLAQSDVLICMLPLTPETQGIINRDTISRLPAGAVVINVGRGGHLVEPDLIEALDSGHLAGAALDVFQVEPLPEEHPFWTHPRITMTPHIASLTNPLTGARVIAEHIERLESGMEPEHRVNFAKGY